MFICVACGRELGRGANMGCETCQDAAGLQTSVIALQGLKAMKAMKAATTPPQAVMTVTVPTTGGVTPAVDGDGVIKVTRCSKCDHLNRAAARFCVNCGTSLAQTKACPNCQMTLPTEAKWCSNCGHKQG